MKHSISVMALLLVSAACATPQMVVPTGSTAMVATETEAQRAYVFERQVSEEDRLQRVAWPILSANAPLCEDDVRTAFGFVVWNSDTVANEYKSVARTNYGLSELVSVRSVAPDSPGARAGLHPGDEIVQVRGQAAPQGRQAPARFVDGLKSVGVGEHVALGVRRQGKLVAVDLSPTEYCDYRVVLQDSSQINAYADGNNIMVTRGMMRFVESDEELALVIAHELAHNAMGHLDAREQNAVVGGIGGILVDLLFAAGGYDTGGAFTEAGVDAGAQSYSVEFEQEADYVGMYALARAGFDTGVVGNFWRRMAAEAPEAIDQSRSHPTTPERFVVIEQTRQEISRKMQDELPLWPNPRPE